MKLILFNILGLVTICFGLLNGVSNQSPIKKFIVGGETAEPGDFPFQVGIQMLKYSELIGQYYNAWCGGSLISNQVVLTAAHCLDGTFSAEIYLGANDLTKNEDQREILKVEKESLIIHENWNQNNFENDVAVVLLPQKISFSEFIQPVALPSMSQKNETFEQAVGWISGWGQLGDYIGPSEKLQYTRRWILPNEHCKDYYDMFREDTEVCVDGSHAISACRGDSGGPLTVEVGDSRLLVGITSYGRSEGCEMGFPVVYTRVSAYLDWIVEKGNVTIKELF